MKSHSKIEVAVTALLRAKELFLLGDYVSSTILAGAGQQILRDVCKSRGIEPTIKTISNESGHPAKLIHITAPTRSVIGSLREVLRRLGNETRAAECQDH